MRAAAVALLAVILLPGCSLLAEPEERELAGPTDGHAPTASFLKVFVRRDDGTLAMMAFERRDWYVAEIARRIDAKELAFVSATVMPRNTLNEYLVERVSSPVELQALRYDDMGASPEARTAMDNEYEALLAKLAGAVDEALPTPSPAVALPEGALP